MLPVKEERSGCPVIIGRSIYGSKMKKTHFASAHTQNAGFGLIQIILFIVLAGILSVALVPDFKDLVLRTKSTKAAELRSLCDEWYSSWTTAGGIHNASTSNAGQMAYTLLTLATSAPSKSGVPKGSGENWADETAILTSRGESIAGAIRIDVTKIGKTLTVDGNYCRLGSYMITFDPAGSNNRGVFTVVDESEL